MSYVLVQDVPASWERYGALARVLGRVPWGLLIHVAGPTDEGFRFIQVWDSEAAWRRFSPEIASALAEVDPEVGSPPIVRDLRGEHLVVGEALSATVRDDWLAAEPGHDVGLENAAGRERGR